VKSSKLNLKKGGMMSIPKDSETARVVDQHPELGVLLRRNWRLEIMRESGDLVRVPEGTLLGPCIDGRKSADESMILNGFKIPGGVYFLMAAVIGKGDDIAVSEACERIAKAGFVPAIHGDEKHGVSGCGFAGLLKEGELPGLPKLDADFKTVKEIVEGRGGVYVELKGEHGEKSLDIVLRRDHTLIPDGGAFILNPQAAEIFGIDKGRLIEITAQTIEMLTGYGGPRVARIYL
jgi:hypothetical protein